MEKDCPKYITLPPLVCHNTTNSCRHLSKSLTQKYTKISKVNNSLLYTIRKVLWRKADLYTWGWLLLPGNSLHLVLSSPLCFVTQEPYVKKKDYLGTIFSFTF